MSSDESFPLHELDRVDFGAWRKVATRELSTLLLFRWDPDEIAREYSDSADWYDNIAESIVLGLWTGDDRTVFCTRIRNQRKVYGGHGCDDESLERVWSLVEAWLPRSLVRWWREYVDRAEERLPHTFNVVGEDDGPRGQSRGQWIDETMAVALRAVEEAAVPEMRSNGCYRPQPAHDVLAQIREQLADAGGTDQYRWSSPDLGLVLRICMDDDLHISSEMPLVDTVRWARGRRLLRDDAPDRD